MEPAMVYVKVFHDSKQKPTARTRLEELMSVNLTEKEKNTHARGKLPL